MAETAKKKAKRPSALKRDLQNQRKRVRSRSHKAQVQTAIRGLNTSLAQKESTDSVQEKVKEICSLMDKGVKRGIYKVNKAARTKSRLTSRLKSL